MFADIVYSHTFNACVIRSGDVLYAVNWNTGCVIRRRKIVYELY